MELQILKPEELREKFKDPWIAPYKKIITMVDNDLVEIIEHHPCISGSHWMIYQYPRTSKLILKAKRDGNRHIYLTKTGKTHLNLRASLNAAGIEEVTVTKDEVKVVHAGLAGAGVGAAMCRGMAKGVKRVELYDVGGGSKVGRAAVITPRLEKVIIGIDDTDTKDKGATWTLAHNIGVELSSEGFEYLDHIIVQLYPHNPYKTQNCVSVALTFAVKPGTQEELIERIIEKLKEKTLSDKTSIAIFNGILIPEKLREYSIRAKKKLVTVDEARKIAEEVGVQLIEVTGAQGQIGALAAIGLSDDVDEAVKVYQR